MNFNQVLEWITAIMGIIVMAVELLMLFVFVP
jgi:hypothetical protein